MLLGVSIVRYDWSVSGGLRLIWIKKWGNLLAAPPCFRNLPNLPEKPQVQSCFTQFFKNNKWLTHRLTEFTLIVYLKSFAYPFSHIFVRLKRVWLNGGSTVYYLTRWSDCVQNSRGTPCLIPPPGDSIPEFFKSRSRVPMDLINRWNPNFFIMKDNQLTRYLDKNNAYQVFCSYLITISVKRVVFMMENGKMIRSMVSEI